MKLHSTEIEIKVVSFRAIADKDLPYLNQAPRELSETEAKLWLAFQHGYGRQKETDVFVSPVGQLLGETQLINNIPDYLIEQLNDLEVSIVSWLLLADAGMGKTMLGKQLTHQSWQHYAKAKSQAKTARLPLYIHLPQIPKSKLKQKLLDAALTEQTGFITASRSESIKLSEDEMIKIKKQPLVLILDGYDEISDRENLFQINSWQDTNKHYDIKVVYTCRPEALV